MSRDDWFATAGYGECSQIEVVFESPSSFEKVQKCGFSLVYKQNKEELNQAIAQCSSSSCVITYEGWDGVHGFDNSTSSCDDYSDIEPEESALFAYNGNDQLQYLSYYKSNPISFLLYPLFFLLSADRKQSQSPYIF